MSDEGYDVGYHKLLRDGRVLNEDQLLKYSCVRCKKVLRDPYQLSCADHVCYCCMPVITETSLCPCCNDPVILEECFQDKCLQREMLVLVVACECEEKFSLKQWEDHKKQCPEIVRQKSHNDVMFQLDNSSSEKSLEFPDSEETIKLRSVSVRSQGPSSEDKVSRLPDYKPEFGNVSMNLAGSLINSTSLKETVGVNKPRSEIVSNSGTTSNQHQATEDVCKYLTDNNPVVLVIYNTNDGSCASPHLRPSPEQPPLIAKKSSELLIPKLQDRGYCVLPVVNKSKSYLEALLDVLGHKHLKAFGLNLTFPDSIKFVMFISSTHGRCDHISMNGELYNIPEILQRLKKIPCDSFLALFDGCQIDKKSFDLQLVPTPYMAIYASPPELPTFHSDGVGICMICLSQILAEDIRTPKDLVDRLRVAYEKEIPKHVKYGEIFQPVCVQNFSPDTVNLQDLTTMAMKPQMNLISHDGVMITVDIQTPKNLLHHPKGNFEISSLSIVVKGSDGEQELKRSSDLEYQRNYRVSLELPPRPEAVNEELCVVACYKNGWKVHSDALEVPMPVYVKPQISSCDRNNCQPVINIIAGEEKERSEPYTVTSIEIQCLLNGVWKLVSGSTVIRPSNTIQRVPITLPHCIVDTTYKVRIVKRYEGAPPAETISDVFEVHQPKLDSPQLQSVTNSCYCQTKIVKFTITNCCDQCACGLSDCKVKYEIQNRWHYCNDITKQDEEIEAKIPFEATAVQAEVNYSQIGVVSSQPFPVPHRSIDKYIRRILCYFCLHKCRSCAQIIFLICNFIFISLLALLLVYFPHSQSHTEIMVSDFTMVPPFHNQTLLTRILYKGVNVYFDFQDSSDNPNMTISIFTSDSMEVKNMTLKKNYSLPLKNNGYQLCEYLPNQYSSPSYFLKDSSITGTVFIKSASDVAVHSARLFGFAKYRNDSCSKEEDDNLVFSSNLLPGVLNKLFNFGMYTLEENSLVYFMVRSTASSEILLNLTLIRHFNYYLGPDDLPSDSYTVIDTAGPSHNVTVPFHFLSERKYYISVQDFDRSQSQIGHFVFTLVPRHYLKLAGIVLLSVSIALTTLLLCCTLWFGSCRNYYRARKALNVSNECTPLLS